MRKLLSDRTTTRPAAKMDEFALSWFFGLGFGASFGCVWGRLGEADCSSSH
jgi:hypothetical protein